MEKQSIDLHVPSNYCDAGDRQVSVP